MSLTVSVVICAYTLDRWRLLQESVASVEVQTFPSHQVIICVDHNPELAARCREVWSVGGGNLVEVVENRFPGRLGSARNTAVERATGDVIAFLDDDAAAYRDWLERLIMAYESNPAIMAVGGMPVPRYSVTRPAWFPYEFDWVFGCVYRGLPQHRSPVRHLIGANMSVRQAAILKVGGFHSDYHDDMDVCHRVAHRFGPASIVYDPASRVAHYVSANRLQWSYFWRRCFYVNRGKVVALADMQEAGNLRAEVRFALRALLVTAPQYALAPLGGGLSRAVATVLGVALSGLGHFTGRVELALGMATPSLTVGIQSTMPLDS